MIREKRLKRVLPIIAVVTALILFLPIPVQMRDGSVEYKALTYKILNCTVSDPCYDPDRQMLYYNFAVTAVDTDGQGLAVLQARMFYDYRGIYQPEVYSVAPNDCSAELINDMQHFFGYELDTPVLSSKLHDLADAKKLLDDNGIRCKKVTGTNVGTGEHDSELLTSFEDAAAASGVLLDIYGSNEEYECYIY